MVEASFPRHKRLTSANHYRYVFTQAKRYGTPALTLLVRETANTTEAQARLGLAIAKKCAKRAVDRNRIKRLIRESFRVQQATLPAVDIVVLCRPNILQLNNAQILNQLDKQWRYISRKHGTKVDKTSQN
ncbi:MAG: ribonuclease P protein component [bacterium]